MLMKKIIFAVAALALFAGCAKEQNAPEPVRETVLKVSLADIGTKAEINGVKISWSAGDEICVNGVISNPLTQGGAVGEFYFPEALTAPYKAVFPKSIYKDEGTITLPSVWNPFEIPLQGYLESGDALSFKSFTSILKLEVTSASEATLATVEFVPLADEQVSGDFSLDYTTGKLTALPGGPADKTLKVIVNKALSATPLTVYMPVPPALYSNGFKVVFNGADGKSMTCSASSRTFVAGELCTMDPVAYVPDSEVEPSLGGIRNAQDFLEFAAAVNAGLPTSNWENEEGWVTLLDDIDFEGVTSWTPVGNAVAPWTSYNPALPEGQKAFTGKFDGNAHHIKNLNLVDEVSVAGSHFGIFGYVGTGAVVQNFVIDDSCSLTVNSSVSHSAGVVAGVVYDATVRDITSYAKMTYKGGATGYLHMALIGGIYASAEGCVVDSVHNRGDIEVENTKNLNAGATAIHAAGIVGFANAGEKSNVVSACNNYGKMTSQAGRTAGIVGAANAKTSIIGCENHGDQLNTMAKSDGTRLGNICCFTNGGSVITGCKNYGNLVSTTSGRVGGIISLPNAGEYEGNENYGEIISDSQYRGVFFGYQTATVAWKGGKASGKVGQYNGGAYVYDVYPEESKINYLGKDGSGGKATYTDVVIDIATGEAPVNPDPELDVDADFRIFFIGNSFTKDAVEHLPAILNAAGLDRIQMIHMYYGGRTVPEYNSGWTTSTDYHCYVCNPGQSGWTDISGKSLAQIAATGKWDVVTIQEHTGRLLAWGWTDAEKEAVQGLKDKVLAMQSAVGGSPKVYYILSQAYHDLSKAQNVTKPFATTDGMWEVIAEQGRKAVEECGFDGVISTGAMLQNLRTSSLNNANGLTRDGYHMDYGIARYGASCTVFETVIGPFNGNVTMDGNTFRTTTESTTDGSWTTAITDQRVPIALQAARYAIEKPYEVTDMGGVEPDPEPEPDVISIGTLDELLDFAAKVNAGDKATIEGTVTLTADIDCSTLTSWTPIGTASMGSNWAHNAATPSGNIFCGSFDGKGHSIKNLNMSFEPSEGSHAWGFFAAIGRGGSVKDLNFDSGCSMSISTGVSGVFGTLAGFVYDADVENVTSAATITGGGTSSLANNAAAGRVTVGGLIGWSMAIEKAVTLTGLKNTGTIGSPSADFVRGSNAGNGANGFMVGGLIGFSTNQGNALTQTLSGLVNEADIYTNAGRVSGIVSTANRYTLVKDCTNSGDVYYSGSGAFRPANITCVVAEGCQLDGCVNTGDLIAPGCASAAGVVCLINHASAVVKSCKSLGATIVCTGFDTATPKATYAGALFGYCNLTATITGCSVSGKVGNTVADAVTLTSDNYLPLSGQVGAKFTTFDPAQITLAVE